MMEGMVELMVHEGGTRRGHWVVREGLLVPVVGVV